MFCISTVVDSCFGFDDYRTLVLIVSVSDLCLSVKLFKSLWIFQRTQQSHYHTEASHQTFGKELVRLTIRFLCVMYICNFGCFQFWFRVQDFGPGCISSFSLLIFYFSYMATPTRTIIQKRL